MALELSAQQNGIRMAIGGSGYDIQGFCLFFVSFEHHSE